MDWEKVKTKSGVAGFPLRSRADPPGKVWADFVHDIDELLTLIEGEQEFDVNGKVIASNQRRAPDPRQAAATSKWLYRYKR